MFREAIPSTEPLRARMIPERPSRAWFFTKAVRSSLIAAPRTGPPTKPIPARALQNGLPWPDFLQQPLRWAVVDANFRNFNASGRRRSRCGLVLGGHFRRLHALGALHDLELYALAFLQAAESLRTNRREMHEYVRAATIGRDETKALGVVEPLHRTH